ncbi:SE1561 family protein [Alkalicoccus daliensis]|uniref:Uncharacterized protein n=1 Tax=Alkalicoccus daliensis TaxID=745820 RepID=A0A1H0DV22_9BACI|nr:SE1561 family protein [Alkalicoccus daliensis]SDN74010.1 hypothetical protein SAMN04488053_10397 [Alkalicoccus daliensis]
MENDKQVKLQTLHERMETLVNVLDTLDPEQTKVEDIDRIINMLDELEAQCQQYRQQYE